MPKREHDNRDEETETNPKAKRGRFLFKAPVKLDRWLPVDRLMQHVQMYCIALTPRLLPRSRVDHGVDEQKEEGETVMIQSRAWKAWEQPEHKKVTRTRGGRYLFAWHPSRHSQYNQPVYVLFDDLTRALACMQAFPVADRMWASVILAEQPHRMFFDLDGLTVPPVDGPVAVAVDVDVHQMLMAVFHFLDETWIQLFRKPFPLECFWAFDASRPGRASIRLLADWRAESLICASLEENRTLVHHVRRRIEQAVDKHDVLARCLCVRDPTTGKYQHAWDDAMYRAAGRGGAIVRLPTTSSCKPSGESFVFRLLQAPSRCYAEGNEASVPVADQLRAGILPVTACDASKLWTCPRRMA